MMESVSNDKGVSPDSQPRLLRFKVNGRPCYAMKWRDERTENRREIDYVMREAGVAESFFLLVDCPLRVPGTPDVVSVEISGRTITRAETTWDIAVAPEAHQIPFIGCETVFFDSCDHDGFGSNPNAFSPASLHVSGKEKRTDRRETSNRPS